LSNTSASDATEKRRTSICCRSGRCYWTLDTQGPLSLYSFLSKASSYQLKVEICNSVDSINKFYKLNCITRKRHGLPPQPSYFFKNIYKYIIAKDNGFVVLASYKGHNVAGAVFFHFGKNAIYKYGASNYTYQHLRPNNIIMWEAIKWYSLNGYSNLCFGITELEHNGLRQFKNNWGTEERIINYYKY